MKFKVGDLVETTTGDWESAGVVVQVDHYDPELPYLVWDFEDEETCWFTESELTLQGEAK